MNSYTTAVLIYNLILPLFLEKSREKIKKCKRHQNIIGKKPCVNKVLSIIFFQIFYLFLGHTQGTLVFTGVIGGKVVRMK